MVGKDGVGLRVCDSRCEEHCLVSEMKSGECRWYVECMK
jgi:hypothetical protein